MICRFRTFLRAVLILIVAIGPLPAQTVFACSMNEQVMTERCCDDHQTDADCVDEQAREDTP